ncbi:MAG TPA: carboxypeptidase-like regulatory domain-containing protein, partial [Steroidobacteraceae bacterium]|nr:carboxypeptidase-like regulatory domain-containing protein [Steroidobacteraceae bacterium]
MRRWAALALLATALFAGVALYYTFESDGRQVRMDTSNFSAARGRLLGKILDGAGERLSGAVLCAYGSESANRLERACASVDGRGAYMLDLVPGQYEITASAPHYASARAKVALAAHKEQRLDLQLDMQPPTLTGIVKSAAGFPIADAQISVYEDERVVSNVNTNDAGVFNAWTPPGKFLVSAAAKGFAAGSVHTVAPALDIHITL